MLSVDWISRDIGSTLIGEIKKAYDHRTHNMPDGANIAFENSNV
ncbi:hypothetical protein ACFQ1H_00290 [Scardovia wiggsiae]